MIHTIQNDLLRVAVKQTGAELSSIHSIPSGTEYMWSGDPNIWSGQAPVLFPIVGGLKDQRYDYQGKSYSLPRHGFFRKNDKVQLTESTTNSLSFTLQSDEELLQVYPFDFHFTIQFTLTGNSLLVNHKIHNPAATDLFFSVGAHPAFKAPLFEGEAYSDYYLEFEKEENLYTWGLDQYGQITGQGPLMLDNSKILNLHPHLFDKDALIFKAPKSSSVQLKSKKSPQILTVKYPGFEYLGIWAKPQAPYVCVEPWLGLADNASTDYQLINKEGIMKLGGGNTFEAAYEIIIEE